MNREGPYLPIDTKINFIEGSVRKIKGGGCNNPTWLDVLPKKKKNSLVRRGLSIIGSVKPLLQIYSINIMAGTCYEYTFSIIFLQVVSG